MLPAFIIHILAEIFCLGGMLCLSVSISYIVRHLLLLFVGSIVYFYQSIIIAAITTACARIYAQATTEERKQLAICCVCFLYGYIYFVTPSTPPDPQDFLIICVLCVIGYCLAKIFYATKKFMMVWYFVFTFLIMETLRGDIIQLVSSCLSAGIYYHVIEFNDDPLRSFRGDTKDCIENI